MTLLYIVVTVCLLAMGVAAIYTALDFFKECSEWLDYCEFLVILIIGISASICSFLIWC